jgi:hypothetical protein
MKQAFVFLCLIWAVGLSAQSYNRKLVVAMLLSKPVKQPQLIIPAATKHSELILSQNVTPTLRFTDPLPRYCLPKGAVVCRLEEYVQLHSPLKLNIGLAGQ